MMENLTKEKALVACITMVTFSLSLKYILHLNASAQLLFNYKGLLFLIILPSLVGFISYWVLRVLKSRY